VKSETNSLEQLSNHGRKEFTRRRSTKAGDVMDCILKLPVSSAEDIHHKGAEGYLKASEFLRRFREVTDSSQAT
jgi:hypothetical protein